MVRFSIADKKNIARAQKQEVYDEGSLFEKPRLVGYRCKKCRIVLPLHLLEVDHIKPRALKGNDHPANLQLLCSRCNKRKGSKIPASLAKTASKATVKKKAASTKAKTKRARTVTKAAVKKKAASTKTKTKRARTVTKAAVKKKAASTKAKTKRT